MAISMFDQILFPLACGHDVVLGRLANTETWVCEKCGKPTNLTGPPFKDQLLKDIDTALQIDLQAKGSLKRRSYSPPVIHDVPKG
jgi:hypothetical protein